MTNVHLMEILYRSLNSVTKPVVDNAAGGSFMDLIFIQASDMLDSMTKKSRAWHTRDSEVASSTVSIGMTAEQRQRQEKRGFRGNAQGNQGQNYYDKSGNKDRDQGSWKNKTDRSGLYIPPGSHEVAASSLGKMSMEDMMAKLLKRVEMEQQLSQLSAAFNQRKAGILPNNTVQNPRNNGSCMDITTRSDCDDSVEAENQNESLHEKNIPLPPLPFPHRLKKKADDTPEKPLFAVLLKVEHEDVEDYEETICALTGLGSYSHAPKQLDLDLRNPPLPTAKTSIAEPLVLESKELSSHLRYAFLGIGNILQVSIAADLGE
ncbi:hypothetical protein CQW23_31082 [Capsicum baccatum]|uniref:Uncharacterized protein n=1 Tax=Capsicum baccatum TaxID=33114 RepID=A0A2G2V8L8_CAPBA|nr:hypothetical protein CQW23_31082 [Capsicum baccatum]